jgi:hypothetical protein
MAPSHLRLCQEPPFLGRFSTPSGPGQILDWPAPLRGKQALLRAYVVGPRSVPHPWRSGLAYAFFEGLDARIPSNGGAPRACLGSHLTHGSVSSAPKRRPFPRTSTTCGTVRAWSSDTARVDGEAP